MSPILERLTRAGDRIFDLLRHPRAFALNESDAVTGDLNTLRGRRYVVLVTFRRNGEPVPSTVWAAVGGGRVYVKTAAGVGKMKRVQRDDRVLPAPSTVRGKPTGVAIRGRCRVLPPEEWPQAEQALRAAYGLARRGSEKILGRAGEPAYLEITARS
ncbi:MAG: PPOX class F420-dependent oxidoreductase [Acidimicrobiales bacterium]